MSGPALPIFTLTIVIQLRIIGGILKGRKLLSPSSQSSVIRPTSDKAREALFNIVGKSVDSAKVLDLFAGSGAVGLEAYSRGAGLVVFIEQNQAALQLIKKNIIQCMAAGHVSGEVKVIDHDLRKGLPRNQLHFCSSHGFDLIFADPPYGTDLSLATLNQLASNNILTQQGLIVIEERKKVLLPSRAGHLELTDRRQYGENSFWIYRLSIEI